MGTIPALDDEPALSTGEATAMQRSASADRREDEREEREMFSRLEKPRVRYDVEVVTKIIVYAGKVPPRLYYSNHLRIRLDINAEFFESGIAWIAVEGNPILFEVLGLGMGPQTTWAGPTPR